MHVLDAIRISEEKMQGHKDFFLCSCFVSAKDFSVHEWTVIFYNPGTGNVIECECNESGVQLSEESRSVKEPPPLRKSDIIKDEAYIMEKVGSDFGAKPVSVLVSLHTKDGMTTWTVSVVTQDLTATIYDIDTKSGDIIRKEKTGLVRRV